MSVRDLKREIQQELHQLTSAHSRDLLYKLAESFKDEAEEELPGAESTEVELFDFIVDFLRSPRLKGLEDQGMSRLLAFRDLIRDLQSPPSAVGEGAVGEAAPSDVKLTSPSAVSDPLTGTNMVDQCKEEVQRALQNNDQALAAKLARKYLDQINNLSLTIAITGESGSGKSSLVNALRGIKNKAPGAAPTGVKETTMVCTEYLHPQNPKIRIWDLPGIGTTNFTADRYLQHVEFEKYDFFIIVSSERFRENDAKLAQEIQRMKKKFYFVRSKVDHSIEDEKYDDPNLNEEDLLKTIRDDCTEGLQDLGIQSPKVFLLSSHKLHLYDFNLLWETLEKELPELQRDALLLTLPVISTKVINQKKKTLESKIIWLTLGSALGAAVPVPGFSEGLDLTMISGFTITCRNSLGLTPDSLQKLSDVSGVSLADLKKELKSPLASVDDVNKGLLLRVLSMSATHITEAAIEEGVRFIPFLGIPVAMALSSFTTYSVLNYILNSLTEDAHRVFRKGLGLNTDV